MIVMKYQTEISIFKCSIYFVFQIAMTKSIENRQRIQDVQAERVKVGHLIKERMAQYQEIKPQLTEIERSINNLHMPPKV